MGRWRRPLSARGKAIAFLATMLLLSGCATNPTAVVSSTPSTSIAQHETASTDITESSTVSAVMTNGEIKAALCAVDENAPKEWKLIQTVVKKQSNCFGPTRYVNASMSNLPATDFRSIDISKCRVENVNNYPRLGFTSGEFYDKKKFPAPNKVLQIIPIYTNDANPSRTPLEDYGQYFSFLKNWVENTSDLGESIEIRIPNKYFYFDGYLSDYPGIERHQMYTDAGGKFVDDVMGSVDSLIDFSSVDATMMIVPPETDNQLLGTNGWSGTKSDYDGNKVMVNFIQTPIDLINNEQDWQVNFTNPFTMLHEMHHGGLDYGDHVDEMGPYGLMGAQLTNLLAWEKWVSGFISDSQVACVDPNSSNTIAIAASETDSGNRKMVVLPISRTNLIVIESQRAIGYNYKLPDYATGVVVYRIDLTKTNHGEGEYLLTDPSLKAGQSITVDGIIISVDVASNLYDIVSIN